MFQGIAYDLSEALKLVEEDGLLLKVTATFLARTNDPGDPPVGPSGQPDLATFTAIPGLQNIPAMLAVWRAKPDIAAVSRLADRFDTLNERHMLLDGYYPQIKQRYVADVTDTKTLAVSRYEIMAAESDSQQNITRLAVRTYTL